MLCEKCGYPLNIVKSRLELINDNTPDLETEVYRCLDLACINKECPDYTGEDLSNPIVIVTTIKHKEA